MGRSLARAGVHFGQVVTGALASSLDALEERLNSGPKSSGAAQGRMRDLLNQDRALLAVQENTARLERSEDEAQPGRPSVRNAPKSGGAARGRMRELLQRDRLMLSKSDDDDEDFEELKRAAGLEAPASAPAHEAVSECAAPECAAVQIVEVIAPAAPEPAPPPPPIAAEPAARAVPLTAAALSALPVAASMPVVPAVSTAARPAAASGLDGEAPVRTRTMAKLFALQGHKERALDIYAELIAADPNDTELAAEAERLRNKS